MTQYRIFHPVVCCASFAEVLKNSPEIPGGDILETLEWTRLVSPRKFLNFQAGEVTERLKVHDWKSCVPLIRVPGVRIPPSPPSQRAEL